MRPVTVYRVDFGWKTKDPIGVVLEKRKTERSNNNFDLLRLARRLFASDTGDAADIIIDVKPVSGERPWSGCLRGSGIARMMQS